MDFATYEKQAQRTMSGLVDDTQLQTAVFALGLAGEAGEVADYLKKVIGHGHDFDRETLVKELGDVLWYLAALAYQHQISLAEVAEANIEKLQKRYPEGFTAEHSINRAD